MRHWWLNKALCFAEDLVQKLQQTLDKLITVLDFREGRQAAVVVADVSRHPCRHGLAVLADLLQLGGQFGGERGRLHHVAAQQGEILGAEGLLMEPSQLCLIQRGAGVCGKQSGVSLQERR